MEGGLHKNDAADSAQNSVRHSMVTYVEELIRNGAELVVDNRVASPDADTIRAVCEDGSYMADYIVGEAGKVSQVRLDRVINS